MSILFCNSLNIEVAGSILLENISLRLEQGQKAGLVGANGAGKTTLLRAILGEIPSEKGMFSYQGTIGYLPQEIIFSEDQGTVVEAMLSGRKDILDMRNQLSVLEIHMSKDAGDKTLEKYSVLTEAYERAGGYSLEAQVRRILAGLGLDQEQSKEIAYLSGGQKTRLALGKLLMQEPELLILDEPTNHLDIEALEWLENYLADYSGSVLVVSHDRYFLDKVADCILLIQNGNLKQYSGNYSEFELQRVIEEKTLHREKEQTDKKIAALEEYIRRHGAGIKAKQARGRETQLKKIIPVTGQQAPKSLKFNLETKARSGNIVLQLQDLAIKYNQKIIFENVSMELRRGDRIALLGRNGVGKTSLLKAITEKVPYSGTISIGANVTVGYYSQEHEDIGIRDNVIDEIRYSSSLDDPQIRNVLARFGFRGEDVFKPLGVLSGGEKSRLALCKLFLVQANLLLLDEPTNHLDMETRELLEEVLSDYNGTILTVSHDRYFLNRIVNKIALLNPKGLRISEGDYTIYREMMENEQSEQGNQEINSAETQRSKKFQEESRNDKRKEKKIKLLEEKIENTEVLLKETRISLESAGGDYEKILQLHTECEKVQCELDELMQEWIVLQEC